MITVIKGLEIVWLSQVLQMTIFKMKPCKLLKAKQSVVLWQVFSPMCISGFYSPFTESAGNHLPFYSEEKQTLLWHLRGESRMKNQGLLLTTPSKRTCVVTQFVKAMENHPGC